MSIRSQDAQVSGQATRGRAAKSEVVAQPAKITAQVLVRDKDGNVKYDGPLVMDVTRDERKEDGSHA